MPISKCSPEWQEGGIEVSARTQILEFLKANADEAFTVRELADILSGTMWAEAHEEAEELQRIYTDGADGLYSDSDSDSDGVELALMDQIKTSFIRGHLEALVYEGRIELRIVATDAFNIPYDWEDVAAYAYIEP